MGRPNIPINKGNYAMETPERLRLFEEYLGKGWERQYKKYRRNWETYPRERFVSEYPLLVDIELSTICNLRCPMCYTRTDHFKNKVPARFMDFELFTKIIDEIGEKVPAVRLSLRGEPTLHKQFVECIQYAKLKGIKEISFLTNGSTLSQDYFEKILKAGADWITISLDGMGETYESVRRPLKFNDMLESVKNLKKIKDQHHTNKPVIKAQSVWPAIRNDPEAFYNTFAPYVDLVAYNPLIDYLSRDIDIVYEDNFSCPQFYQRLLVGVNGHAMMCSNDEFGEMVVGDANKETIYEIWHGGKLQHIRNIHKQKSGFLRINICKRCYLPRLTDDSETAVVQGRKFAIKNYVNRSQKIGE